MKTLNWAKIDKYLNVAFSFGAAVVIYGALTKILHWHNADSFLMIGLISESVIFSIMGIVTWAKPAERQMEIYYERNEQYQKPQQLTHVDITQELTLFRTYLNRINKMMENILNSSK